MSSDIVGFGPFGSQFPVLQTIVLHRNYSSELCLQTFMEVFPNILHLMCDAIEPGNYTENT